MFIYWLGEQSAITGRRRDAASKEEEEEEARRKAAADGFGNTQLCTEGVVRYNSNQIRSLGDRRCGAKRKTWREIEATEKRRAME